MSSFDNAAATWDENPVHLERSQAIAEKMRGLLPLHTKMQALEYGAGTGILSFLLSDRLGHVTMMDSSAGMVKVMEEKVAKRNSTNLTPLFYNLEEEVYDQTFDLVFNQMVLHHIKDVPGIFSTFFKLLNPGGILAIADLYPEDGSFHGEGIDVHFGFDPEKLGATLKETGFHSIRFEQCYAVVRKAPDGTSRSYPVFLLTAAK